MIFYLNWVVRIWDKSYDMSQNWYKLFANFQVLRLDHQIVRRQCCVEQGTLNIIGFPRMLLNSQGCKNLSSWSCRTILKVSKNIWNRFKKLHNIILNVWIDRNWKQGTVEIILNMKDFLFVDAPGKYVNPIILQKLKAFRFYGNPEHNVNSDMSKRPIIFLDIFWKTFIAFAPVFCLPKHVNTFNAQ